MNTTEKTIEARSFRLKRVLITGSGPGIGQAIAERFASEGAKVQHADGGQNKGA